MKQHKLLLILLTFFSFAFSHGQNSTVVPTENMENLPPPDEYQYQTMNAGGPGAPASPIDDYIFLLLPLVVMMIVYFAYRYRKQLS